MIPDDYFAPIEELGKPIVISETSWHTRGSGSEKAQDLYLKWILERAADSHIPWLIWTGMCDTLAPQAGSSVFELVAGLPAWMGSLGLWDINGRPKSGAARWQGALKRPYHSRGNCQIGP